MEASDAPDQDERQQDTQRPQVAGGRAACFFFAGLGEPITLTLQGHAHIGRRRFWRIPSVGP